MPHVPLGFFAITLVAGNEVNMDMEDTLPGRRPHVCADRLSANRIASALRHINLFLAML